MHKKWLVFNIIFIILIGVLSHYAYDWSNQNKIVGLFTAVNESTWEHIKLAIFPIFLLLIIEYSYLKDNKNYFIGYFLSLFVVMLLIPLIFYGYKYILGENILILDILDFILSVIISQFIFYKIMHISPLAKTYRVISIIGILIILGLYLNFTYNPPKMFLFKDPITNTYGIVEK